MKMIKYSLLIAVMSVAAFSCEDKSLDPLQIDSVVKGTILALRGTQLNNIYVKGLPGAEFNPRQLNGTDPYTFDAEYLSDDPTSLESMDIYVITRPVRTKVFLMNVPASDFKDDGTYRLPWVTVTTTTDAILSKVLTSPTYPLSAADQATMLTTYSNGIALEIDLNLKDGTNVFAVDLVSAGLFQSDQFYPAQKLTYAVLDYCPEDIAGTYSFLTTGIGCANCGASSPGVAGCTAAAPITGTGELKVIGTGKYSISDITFGQYDCAWGDTPAVGGTLSNACDRLKFGGSDQYGLIYTISNVSVSPDGLTLTFNWENDYGDSGTSALTRTDAKLWPLTLFS